MEAPSGFTHLVASLVLLSRVGDVLSTRLATPTLRLEANTLVRRLGWPFAFATLLVALVPYYNTALGVVALTMSLLVTGSNLSRGWVARALGEAEYEAMLLHAAARSRLATALAFILAAASCVAAVGGLLMLFSSEAEWGYWFGLGIVIYGVALAWHGSSFARRLFHAASAVAAPNSTTSSRQH